jgi:hypothetical protein
MNCKKLEKKKKLPNNGGIEIKKRKETEEWEER